MPFQCKSVKYRYGADGQRTNKYSITSDKGESIYFNKLWTWRWDSYTPSAGNYCKNIFLDKTRIVTKVRAADETSSADSHREYFYHGDHLQSATLITDYEGSVYERINYTPYGELWLEKSDNNGENYLPYRFTGKELDSETGLYYYGARYLDPKYSRWLSTDPALGDYIPQAPINDEVKKHNQNLPGMGGVFNQLNCDLYHYAGNNPVKYTDPDGEITLTPGMSRAAAWGIRIGTVIEDVLSGGVGVADDAPTLAFAEGLMITATLMELSQNLEDQVSNNLKSNAQSPVSAAGSPSPNNEKNNNNDDVDENKKQSNDDDSLNFTKREINEAKRQFSSNKKFRDYFHREYKPSEKNTTNGKHNPDLTDEQITEAYKEWQKFYGEK